MSRPNSPTARSEGRRRWVGIPARWLLLALVPSLFFGVWLLVAPTDRMAPRADDHYLPALVYDEFDLSAMALRGLNAELGRHAGAPRNPEMVNSAYFPRYLAWPNELRPRYFLEYPHSTLLLFRAGYWIQPDWREAVIPSAVLDCDYHNVAEFYPETESEFAWIKPFATAAHFYAAVMFAALLGLIVVLEMGYGGDPPLRGGTLLMLLPAALFFAFNRFDILPAFFTAVGFACLGRGRSAGAALGFGLATLIKVYPILFVPLILRYLWPNRRDAARFLMVFVATGLLAFTPMLFGEDWQAVFAPYRFQLTRPPENGMILYGCCLPLKLAGGTAGMAFRLGSLSLTIVLMLATPISDLSSLLRRCALVLLVFTSLAVFYSPQWIIWFAPLLLPLVGRDRRIGWGVATLDLLTYLTFPLWFWILPEYSDDYLTRIEPLLMTRNMGSAWEVSLQLMNDLGNFLRASRGIWCVAMVLLLVRLEWGRPKWLRRLNLRLTRGGPLWRRQPDRS